MSFIDYEYATPSPAAFDIANHFAEWAGFECDHGAVPTRSQRMDFLKVGPMSTLFVGGLLTLHPGSTTLDRFATTRYRRTTHKR